MTTGKTLALVERSSVPQRSEPTQYRQELRVDFCFACAYCSITEAEAAGIDFQIDHYLPLRTNEGLRAAYLNLMYSCGMCNREKGDYDSSEAPDDSRRVFKIDEEGLEGQFELDSVRLKPLTPKADFNEDLLRLNRLALRRLRAVRRELHLSREAVMNGLRRFIRMPAPNASKNDRLEILRHQAQLQKEADKLDASLEDLIRESSRSPLLEPDQKGSKRYDEYLRRQRALLATKP